MGIKKLEKEIKIINEALKNSISWLERSGIQNSKNKKNPNLKKDLKFSFIRETFSIFYG